MEPVEAFKAFIWTRLTSDSQMQTLFGGTVRVDNVWPEPDQEMPYIVYRFRRINEGPVAAAVMTLDLWDNSPTGQRITDITKRVSDLLDWVNYKTSELHARVRKDNEVEIQEDERYIWHISAEWAVRLTRDMEIAGSIIG